MSISILLLFYFFNSSSITLKDIATIFLTNDKNIFFSPDNRYKLVKTDLDDCKYAEDRFKFEVYENEKNKLATIATTPFMHDHQFKNNGQNIQLLRNHKRIIVNDKKTNICSTIELPKSDYKEMIFDLAISQNEHYAACLTYDGAENILPSEQCNKRKLYIYEIETKRIIVDKELTDATVVTLSSNGQYCATGNSDGEITIYDLESKNINEFKAFDEQYNQIYGLAFSDDSRNLLAVAYVSMKSHKITNIKWEGSLLILKPDEKKLYLKNCHYKFKMWGIQTLYSKL